MDTVRTAEYILGADDGGSGVGVLVELARVFSENPPPIGVDIVLFDGEDYGVPSDLDMYFLGSRYWSQNPPVAGYSPGLQFYWIWLVRKRRNSQKKNYR